MIQNPNASRLVNAGRDDFTGAEITLTAPSTDPRFNWPCCGGTRPAHTSRCRDN